MSGAAVKPICLRLVVDVMKTVPNAQIFGLGGIVTWYDAMEHMMLGARAVESVTGVMWYGYGIITS